MRLNLSGHGDYDHALRVLASGDEAQWEELELLLEGFPHGEDDFLGRRWIINAVDCGSVASVRWLLARGVDLRFRDDEGYTVLHSALDRKGPERYELLELLLDAGADPDAKGLNDWTPAHLAAVREDLEALRILVAHGADLSVRTNIDEYATPLEEARRLRKLKSVEFLEAIERVGRRH
jgi:ankyrin repeat protein